ncbi:putative glycerophosphoryl diester phosphodiesterase 1 [Acorus calamus]|uniref:glycerophosphodiester phosphodiesterase n=1 Tax=Acorus calamus TaxID=4465 RepID=A0AAV9DZB3_ACOCL|nr:putative glycerophosphoryl diester phosphodiesterase 1 [Acorus calamus]
MLGFHSLLLFLILLAPVLVTAQRSNSSQWLTSSGNAPIVIAKGGFSGQFPDSSFMSYQLALNTSLPDTVLWCDVHLTKDGNGICLPNILLNNSTDITSFYPKVKKTYLVNGVAMEGWFSKDFTLNDLVNVSLTQGIYSRSEKFDSIYAILAVSDVAKLKPPGIWLNIQYAMFYAQQNLSMISFLSSASRTSVINYVSSPEVGFLRSVASTFNRNNTKLVFRFLESDAIEPSTNQSYASLLKNLTFIKTFASGILVPKYYIWPVSPTLYLEPHTSVVTDARKAGLEIYASEFANDVHFPYNYSYDPIAEYLSFIDNTEFSVDGVLSDFPITPSAAIDCFSHTNETTYGQVLVISNNGASGVYPGCTDLSYIQAVDDRADIIDCNVQVTSDQVPICLSSIDLLSGTTVAQVPPFSSRTSTVPKIQTDAGIFTFNFTWDEIQKLSPEISNPLYNFRLLRNPAYKNAGKFWSLSKFLNYAKDKSLVGVMLKIENAAYLASQQGIDVVDIVITALNDAGYNNQTGLQVFIQSNERAVLVRFKQKQLKHKLVYVVDEQIRDATKEAIDDIQSFADAVVINKQSIYPTNLAFIIEQTNVVQKLKSANLTVYAYLFRNEYVSQAWDFLSDPTVELNTFVQGAQIDGVITDFPKTAVAYKKNKCLSSNNPPSYMKPVQVGNLLRLIPPFAEPPAEAPNPVLTDADVTEPPLPPVSARPGTNGGTGNTPLAPVPPPPGNGQTHREVPIFLSLALMLGSLFI